MEHRERYLELLSLTTRGRLLRAIRKQGYFEALKITAATVVDAQPLPYLRFDIESDPGFVARSGGLLIDLTDVVDVDTSERFYLPYIAFTPDAQPTDEAHELTHLRDLLELLRLEPGYAEESERLGMFNFTDPELLEPSIRFEVRKLFTFEVSAFGKEFDDGTREINMPILPGLVFDYRCESRAEFIRLWLTSYLQKLGRIYEERFPKHVPQIQEALAAATDEYGHDTFGDEPWACAIKTWHDLPSLIAAQALKRLA